MSEFIGPPTFSSEINRLTPFSDAINQPQESIFRRCYVDPVKFKDDHNLWGFQKRAAHTSYPSILMTTGLLEIYNRNTDAHHPINTAFMGLMSAAILSQFVNHGLMSLGAYVARKENYANGKEDQLNQHVFGSLE